MNIYDISEKAGVSIATVSRVLNQSPHVSAKTKAHVLSVIQSCGYVPNAFARGLGLNSMKTIGLLCPNAADPYLAQALAYLEGSFRLHRYDCLLSCTGSELDARRLGVERLSDRHVDGLVLMGSTFIESDDAANDYIREAAKRTPIVLLNASLRGGNVYCVLCDDHQATLEAARFLIDSGRKRVLYLYHSRNYSGQRKLSGYRDALASRGIEPDEALIHCLADGKRSVTHVRDYLLDLRQSGLSFDAVLTSEDIMAVGAAKYARAMRLSMPDDLSVIGYNNSTFCQCCEPELTSVDNRLSAICEQCVQTMLGVLEGREMPQINAFTAQLVRRGSTL